MAVGQYVPMTQQYFRCTDYKSTILNWELATTSGQYLFLPLYSSSHPEGTTISKLLGSSLMEYEVTGANSSFISATLSILNPLTINGSMISCNGETLLLTVTVTTISKLHKFSQIKS